MPAFTAPSEVTTITSPSTRSILLSQIFFSSMVRWVRSSFTIWRFRMIHAWGLSNSTSLATPAPSMFTTENVQ